jgi:hypothetical protein
VVDYQFVFGRRLHRKVGARAARSQKNSDSNKDFGTRALPLFERADK